MLETLKRIVQEVNDAHNFGESLQLLVRRVKEAVATHACSVMLYDPRAKQYVLMATDGLNPSMVGHLRMHHQEGLVGMIGQRAEPLNLENAQTHPQFSFHPEVGEEKFQAFLGAPIIHHRQLLGVIFIQQEESRRFDATEEAFLVTIAAQLSGIIAHAHSTSAVSRLLDATYADPHREHMICGTSIVPGIGIGQAVVIYPLADLDSVPERTTDQIDEEVQKFLNAIQTAKEEISAIGDRLAISLSPEDHALFDVYLRILSSDSLQSETIQWIKSGHWAQGAVKRVIKNHINKFDAMNDDYLRGRAHDLKDLGTRIIAHLQSQQPEMLIYPEKTILVGEQITVTDLAGLPPGKIVGIISSQGSHNSHLAILARAMNIPTLMGVTVPKTITQNTRLIVDSIYGQIFISPSEKIIQEYEALLTLKAEADAGLESLRQLPAETLDGHTIPLLINTGLPSDTSFSLSMEAEGIGLYRTELLFMIRDSFPSEEEQRILYRQLLKSLAPRPVIMRTLDIGGDKALSYFPIEEDNPFLGWRGIRVTLDHPEVFLVQTRAMLKASADLDNLRIMLPMVSCVTEVDEALRLLNKAYQEVLSEDKRIKLPPIGVMIEVPSAVYLSESIAQKVDFLSVGSNDLTQYLLAVDRNNARVANLYDALHPAVLRALAIVVENAHRAGKKVSICGEMAADPLAIVVLLGLGFDALSVSSAHLLRVKSVIRKFKLEDTYHITQEILKLPTAQLIRERLKHRFSQNWLELDLP